MKEKSKSVFFLQGDNVLTASVFRRGRPKFTPEKEAETAVGRSGSRRYREKED